MGMLLFKAKLYARKNDECNPGKSADYSCSCDDRCGEHFEFAKAGRTESDMPKA